MPAKMKACTEWREDFNFQDCNFQDAASEHGREDDSRTAGMPRLAASHAAQHPLRAHKRARARGGVPQPTLALASSSNYRHLRQATTEAVKDQGRKGVTRRAHHDCTCRSGHQHKCQ